MGVFLKRNETCVFNEGQAAALLEPYFKAAKNLEELYNRMAKKPIFGKLELQGIVFHLVRIMANDYGAILTLVRNGYGVAAMKIARSMFESECNIFHLKNNSGDLQDYLEWSHISVKKLFDQLDPEQQARVEPEDVAQMNADYARVEPRFRNKRGELRNAWCRQSIHARAKAAGLADLYVTFYGIASSIHHGDMNAVIHALDSGAQEVEVAPSYAWLEDALVAAHEAMVRSLSYFNDIANLGFDVELEKARDECAELFKGR